MGRDVALLVQMVLVFFLVPVLLGLRGARRGAQVGILVLRAGRDEGGQVLGHAAHRLALGIRGDAESLILEPIHRSRVELFLGRESLGLG